MHEKESSAAVANEHAFAHGHGSAGIDTNPVSHGNRLYPADGCIDERYWYCCLSYTINDAFYCPRFGCGNENAVNTLFQYPKCCLSFLCVGDLDKQAAGLRDNVFQWNDGPVPGTNDHQAFFGKLNNVRFVFFAPNFPFENILSRNKIAIRCNGGNEPQFFCLLGIACGKHNRISAAFQRSSNDALLPGICLNPDFFHRSSLMKL